MSKPTPAQQGTHDATQGYQPTPDQSSSHKTNEYNNAFVREQQRIAEKKQNGGW